jgi:hypothetical protein
MTKRMAKGAKTLSRSDAGCVDAGCETLVGRGVAIPEALVACADGVRAWADSIPEALVACADAVRAWADSEMFARRAEGEMSAGRAWAGTARRMGTAMIAGRGRSAEPVGRVRRPRTARRAQRARRAMALGMVRVWMVRKWQSARGKTKARELETPQRSSFKP